MHEDARVSGMPSPRPFRTDIQGLRAVAVLGVLLYHGGVPGFGGGYVGVDVFFVISGFLITGNLLAALDRDGRPGFASFYARRARRILPAAMVVVVVTVAAVLLVVPRLAQAAFLRDAVATVLYVPNILFAVTGTEYLADHAPSPFLHYWSLGVEEQFYLLWPLGLFGAWLLARRGARSLAGRRGLLLAIAAAVVAVSLLAAIVVTYRSQPWAFYSLPTRAWELAVGGCLAIAAPWIERLRPGLAVAGGWLGGAAIVVAMVALDETVAFPGFAALLPVVGAALVIASGGERRRFDAATVLGIAPMQFLGRISYSLYLVHWPLLVVPAVAAGLPVLDGWQALVALAIALPAAWLLNVLVEQPFQHSAGMRRARPRSVLIASGLATAVIASSVGVGNWWSTRSSIDAGRPADPVAVSPSPDFQEFVPENMTPSIREVADDLPEIYPECHLDSSSSALAEGCAFGDRDADAVVALFGDSHAAQWFPAFDRLGEEHGFRLDVYTKSSCPSVRIDMVTRGVLDRGCETWRDAVLDRFAQDPPDRIVLANFSHYEAYGTSGVDDDRWAAGLDAMLGELPSSSSVAVIADTPEFATAPATCLSGHVDDADACARPRDEAIAAGRAAAEARVASAHEVPYVDLTDYLCDPSVCGVVIGTSLVYRDRHHLTASFAAELRGPLWEALDW